MNNPEREDHCDKTGPQLGNEPSGIAAWLIRQAQQFEDQHAPQHLTIGLREAAGEIERLNRELDDVWDALAIQREDNASFGDAFKRQAAEIKRLRAKLALFACDCAVNERCAVPDNCRNFQARRMLEANND
jgi:hypothetical protein